MATLPISNQGQILETENRVNQLAKRSLLDKYLSYADKQEDQYIFWYMTAILVIPCVLMTLSIIVMYLYSSILEYYIGFAMLLFFANVLVHIAGMRARVYLPILHITAALMIIIPAVTYLISVL